MNSNSRPEAWSSGEGYESYVGRWSRLVAREFVQWLDIQPGKRWLDLGTGTGALTRAILDHTEPTNVLALDASDGYIAHTRNLIQDPRVTFEVGAAQALNASSGAFDVVVSGLVINFLPNRLRAVMEMTRVARLNGRVAAYVWDYAGEMQLMRYFWDAAVELDPAAAELDEGQRFAFCTRAGLRDLFLDARLNDVTTRAIDVPTHFKDFDDYWSPFLGGQGPAPGYALSLSEEQRAALRERLRARLPMNRDGSIDLVARAWAVRGLR